MKPKPTTSPEDEGSRVMDCMGDSYTEYTPAAALERNHWLRKAFDSICMIYYKLPNGKLTYRGTGFVGEVQIGAKRLRGLFTAYHVIPNSALKLERFLLHFSTISQTMTDFPKNGVYWANAILDVIFITWPKNPDILGSSTFLNLGPLGYISPLMDPSAPVVISVLHHPLGQAIQYSNGRIHGFLGGFQLYHTATCDGGSSGAPILRDLTNSNQEVFPAPCGIYRSIIITGGPHKVEIIHEKIQLLHYLEQELTNPSDEGMQAQIRQYILQLSSLNDQNGFDTLKQQIESTLNHHVILEGPLYLGTCMNVVRGEIIRHYDESFITKELPSQNPLQSRANSYINLNCSQPPPRMPEGSVPHSKVYSLKFKNEIHQDVELSNLQVHYLDNSRFTRIWYIESGNLIFKAEDSPWSENISAHPCIWNLS